MNDKKMLLKVIAVLLSLLLITMIAILINPPWESTQAPTRRVVDIESDNPMIGFSVDALIIERWQRDLDILKTRAEERGFQFQVLNAYENVDKQIEHISALVDEGAVAIFILAYDKDALADVVEEARRQGVIVIAYDRLISNAQVDAYVSFDNVLVGELMAQALVEEVPMGNYVIINGSPLDNNSMMFNEGYYNVLQPLVAKGDITIIEEVWADDWREDIAYNTVNRLISDGIEIDAVIGANDLLAEGAISVLSEYGLVGDVQVVGHDADISACQRIVEGKQLMTVYKPLKNLAEGSVDLVYQMLTRDEVEFNTYINDGTYDVPFVKFNVIPVNKDNMRETIVKDFFHSEQDIYRLSE